MSYRRGWFRNVLWSVTSILFLILLVVFLVRALLGVSSASPTTAPMYSDYEAAYNAGWSDGYDAGYEAGYTFGRLEALASVSDPTPEPTNARSYAAYADRHNLMVNTTPRPTEHIPPYIGNRNSLVLHRSSCSYVDQMKPSNKVPFDDRTEAIDKGYKPCSRCKP